MPPENSIRRRRFRKTPNFSVFLLKAFFSHEMIQLKPRTDTFVVFSLEHNTILAKHGIFQNKQYCDEDAKNADSVNCYKKCLLDKNVPKEVFHSLFFMDG